MLGVGGGVVGGVRASSGPSLYQIGCRQELDALLKKKDLQSWKSTSNKPSVVTWNFMNVLSSRREGVVREGVVEKDCHSLREMNKPVRSDISSSASEGGFSNDFEDSEEEEEAAETVESKEGEEEEEDEEELSGQEREVSSKSRKSSGAGGVGGEEKFGCQEEEQGSKRRRRIGVRGDPDEGGREEGGEGVTHTV